MTNSFGKFKFRGRRFVYAWHIENYGERSRIKIVHSDDNSQLIVYSGTMEKYPDVFGAGCLKEILTKDFKLIIHPTFGHLAVRRHDLHVFRNKSPKET